MPRTSSGIEVWTGNYDGLGETVDEEQLAFFESRIRPLLVERCYECHSAESDAPGGDLLVDSRATLRRGGASGPAVVPGEPKKSRLIEAVRYEDPHVQMPPEGKLSEREIADLERWVAMGAPDPRVRVTRHSGKQIDVTRARQFWSLKPIEDPALPAVRQSDWPVNDVDRFILARLETAGLSPAPEADKRTLIRRITYDLTGLPPTAAEVRAFLEDSSTDAFEKVVDRLLASPHYGERWGRHWLDVVRYADTAGDNSDYPIPQMHRYRDWVIDAFNRDLPYDEFVRDQLAGDLRGGNDEHERQQRLIATGYLANARRFGSRVSDYPQHLTIEDTIDNLGRAFLGLTVSCARCHDHKFDPITARDYYALYGIFQSTRYPWPGIELDKRQRDFVPLVPKDQLESLVKQEAQRKKEQARLDNEVKRLREALKKAGKDEKENIETQLKEAERKAKEHRELPPLYETAYAVADAESLQDVAVQLKGDPTKPGDVVRRRFLTVLGGETLSPDCNESGRRELAEWIVAESNPLTARVMVNRIWQHHFGRGIVPTPNDFGRQGKLPTHPELLDALASRFRESGWSIKQMHRLIVLSRTYRQSSFRSAEAVQADPNNELLAGFVRRRLDAESLRDTLLVIGGNLDLSVPGAHPFPPQHTWDFTQHKPFKAVYETNHRSVYLMTQRIQRHPFLAIFDGADPSTSTAVRTTTTTPLQALYLLNDPFVHEQMRLAAHRVLRSSEDRESRIRFAFELVLCRPPADEELTVAGEYLDRAGQLLAEAGFGGSPTSGNPGTEVEAEAWRSLLRTLVRLNEFLYLD